MCDQQNHPTTCADFTDINHQTPYAIGWAISQYKSHKFSQSADEITPFPVEQFRTFIYSMALTFLEESGPPSNEGFFFFYLIEFSYTHIPSEVQCWVKSLSSQ